MNIYVIYKFADYALVKETVDKIRDVIPSENRIFMFTPDRAPRLWHYRAMKKLKESHYVILFDSLTGENNPVGKHISWELKKAEKLNKHIVIFKADPDAQNRSWYEKDYSEQNPLCSRYKTVPIHDAVTYMAKEFGWLIDENLLHKEPEQEPLTDSEQKLLLEQYRIMIETSEKLMQRRQETVTLYTTLCTTLIAFIGASFAFPDLLLRAMILLLSGLLLVLLCRNWRLSLQSYDLNNTGKFKVINLLEKRLPAEIFECEYRYNKLNGIRSFSAREKMLPRIFSFLGFALILLSVISFAQLALEKLNL